MARGQSLLGCCGAAVLLHALTASAFVTPNLPTGLSSLRSGSVSDCTVSHISSMLDGTRWGSCGRAKLPQGGRKESKLVLSMASDAEGAQGAGGEGSGEEMSPEEAMIERLVEKLELSLDTAIKKEHFKDAKTLRDELRKMHIDDSSSVLRANSDFYKAFTSKNITLMGAVWQDSDTVQCVQPGSRPVVGYTNIIEMWSNMFVSKDHAFSTTNVKPTNVRVHVRGTSAFVMCTEEVSGAGLTRRMIATNIFRKARREWRLVHHHASQAARGGAFDMPKGTQGILRPGVSRIIRLDGNSIIGDSGKDNPSGDAVIDDIVKAIMGALGDGEGGGGESADEMLRTAGVFGDMFDTAEDSTEDSDEEDDDLSEDYKRGDSSPSSRYEEVPAERELGVGVTQGTVEALRRLQSAGKITRDDKRRLIADIIEHHKAGEAASSIEIAYELLVSPFVHPDSEFTMQSDLSCLDDLADQAKSIASRLRW